MRSLTKGGQADGTTQLEFPAIVLSVLVIWPYLVSRRFTIRTDRDSLKIIFSLADATGRLARWRLRLSEFDVDVRHRAGIKHQAADVHSRLTNTEKDQASIKDNSPIAVLETTSENKASMQPVLHKTTLLDEASIWAVAKVIEDNDTTKEKHSQHCKSFCVTGERMPSADKLRKMLARQILSIPLIKTD